MRDPSPFGLGLPTRPENLYDPGHLLWRGRMPRNFWVAMLAVSAVAASMPAWGQGQPPPTYAAKGPSYITTPDTVETRIGALKFFDGLPDSQTVQKVYDNLDF